jgi:hypothetical protein
MTNTDSDGHFFIYAPEAEAYFFLFQDVDGFENGGFFTYKDMTIPRSESENPLVLSLHQESKVVVIHGTVLAKGTSGKPIAGIRVDIGPADGPGYRFEGLSDNDGNFSIQVPEREAYSIGFFDTNFSYKNKNMFMWQRIEVSTDEIKQSLKVEMELQKIVPEEPDEATE